MIHYALFHNNTAASIRSLHFSLKEKVPGLTRKVIKGPSTVKWDNSEVWLEGGANLKNNRRKSTTEVS